MHLSTYLDFLRHAEQTLAEAYRTVSAGHAADADVHFATAGFAARCDEHARALGPVIERYGAPDAPVPDRLHVPDPGAHRQGPAGLLRDLLDLYQLGQLVDITWTLVGQAAQAARDGDLIALTRRSGADTGAQIAWLGTALRSAAPQTLLVAD